MSEIDENLLAEAILADLVRQSQLDKYDAPWLDEFRDILDTNIDGRVNLVEVARAIMAAIDASDHTW